MNRFQGKTVLISGGSGGMGMSIAHRFTQEGAIVVLADLIAPDTERLQRIFGDLPYPHWVQLDVTQAASWEQAVAYVVEQYQHLDVLVNNAGVVMRGSHAIDELPLDDWQRLFSINVDGTLLGLQAAIRVMKQQSQGGSIVNLGSVAGQVGSRDAGAYGASKAAVTNLTKQAALSAARFGYKVRVNAVHPGYVWTPLVEAKLIQQFGSLEAAQQAVRAMNPMGDIVTTEDVAASVAFLASRDARMITGADLVIDGGRLIQ
ncbi:SDR family NAD(P)-dependent oxidoreductase [Bordetella avium]|uniref:SDR family NAD(P)-dependent oxidoreductase n=2 Tax=Bordetella avium TaxID=521 RepID=UPI000E0B0C84|nr:SDR family oxidoreductase [Bordetella avium]RIQ15054.1 SDR family oxidoreductase [Bordetella avium]RIQ41517.1 SDR family oxidoreductase [Bordetella avium]RIQ45692.1 SDR family oxidoreductase [Bordetella avium]RIQ46621.1 SDR family oxidoreductase [Bordetella avium]RIQ49854.1 SDR family oxidoreductase [Bordetella avium]